MGDIIAVIKAGTVGPQKGLPGGGTQIEIRIFDRKFVEEWFDNPEKIGERF